MTGITPHQELGNGNSWSMSFVSMFCFPVSFIRYIEINMGEHYFGILRFLQMFSCCAYNSVTDFFHSTVLFEDICMLVYINIFHSS